MKLFLRFFGFLFAAGTLLFVVGIAAASLLKFEKSMDDHA
jgi:hypothetical protein